MNNNNNINNDQVGPPLKMPEKTTICLRTLHNTFMNPVVSSYAFSFFFGSLLPVRLSIIINPGYFKNCQSPTQDGAAVEH